MYYFPSLIKSTIGTNGVVTDLNIVSASIIGRTRSGVLAGQVGAAGISNVHVSGNVTGKSGVDYIGGFIGNVAGAAIIQNCSATGDTTSTSSIGSAGGFIGWLGGVGAIISNCFATGDVVASGVVGNAGGFVGWVTDGDIVDCYATGDSTGHVAIGNAGGFAGLMNQNIGTITSSYSTGAPSAATSGGFCGSLVVNEGLITACYYDSTTSGKSDTGRGIPQITEDMKLLATFIGWDFTEDTGVWNISEEISYPLFDLMPSPATVVSPANGGSDVSALPLLDWSAGSPWTPVSYDVYFGTTSGSLSLISEGQIGTSYQLLSALSRNTEYFWRVDSIDQNAIDTGTEWSFTIGAFAPPLPSGTSLVGGEQTGTATGTNNMVTIKKLIGFANNTMYYET